MRKNAYSVSQVNVYIKNMFSQDFMLRNICIKGEVSNCKYHSSGHIYFTIKDEKSAMSAIMFAGNRKGLKFPMREGDKVIITGSVETFERDGKYQLYAKEIQKDGEGSLFLRFEALKRELEEMGMFAAEYKKPIPKYIQRLGIVTAPTGAAVQDIRNISARRNPFVQLILYPAQVQGEGAAASIVNGIRALDALGVDTIIVGRGGGSIEDLWAFNEEIVARAIFECETPIISAVGHETDTTIADYVADMRAPTPSAAAELAVYDAFELEDEMLGLYRLLKRAMEWKLDLMHSRSKSIENLLRAKSPANQLNEKKQYALNLEAQLEKLQQQKLMHVKYQLGILAGQLEGLSPAKKLSQGLAFVTDSKGRRISEAKSLKKKDGILVRFQDGVIEAEVKTVTILDEKQ